MGVATLHALPRERQFYAKAESTFGTVAQPAGTDAMKVLPGTQFGAGKITRINRGDNKPTRDVLERITGNIDPIDFTVESYILPSGSAGTAPDAGPLFKAAMGVETVVGATSVAYTTTDTQGVQDSLTLYDNVSYVFSQHLLGSVVQEMKLSGGGGDPPRVTFSGQGRELLFTGRSALAGAFSTSTVTVADGSMFKAGSLVAIVDPTTLAVVDSNSGAGFPVASVSGNTVVVTGTPSGTDTADILIPWAPAGTYAGNPLSGKDLTTMTIGGTAVRVTAWEVSLNNNHTLHVDEAGQQRFTDYDEGERTITGKLTFRARQDWAVWMAERTELGTRAISIVVSQGAGKIMTIAIPYAELEFEQIGLPEQGTAMFSAPFVALGSSGNDALSVTFT